MIPTFLAADGRRRCAWCAATPDYIAYHDREWGFPVVDDRRLFEKLALESFQAGLSWRTILAKREQFRRAFAGFDIATVAAFDAADVARLLGDAGIVRHRGKIEAVINNARRARAMIDGGQSLATFVWGFEPDDHGPPTTLRATAPESVALSNALRALRWRFVGPTTIYAFMQAMGLVNDHVADCDTRPAAEAARAALIRPR